jgi:hypothetical protein
LPSRIAATLTGACMWSGVATITASTDFSVSSSLR